MGKDRAASSAVIGPVMISFPQLDKPKAIDGSDKLKYSCRLYIKKDDDETIAMVKKAMMAAAKANGAVFKGKPIGGPGFKWAIRDADKERKAGKEHGPESKGCFFIQASSETAPGVVDRNKKPIIDIKSEVYAGCWVYASVNFFAYNQKGNWGVSCGLNNILKYKDDKRLAGKPSAESDFKDLDIMLEDDDEFNLPGMDSEYDFLGGEDDEDDDISF
jgi:hypothetical protein